MFERADESLPSRYVPDARFVKQATQESARRLIFERENTIPRVRNYRREYATLYTVWRVV